MWLFEGPFNKVVRSHEALILGLLVGVVVGVILMISVNIAVKYENWKIPITLCNTEANVESVSFSYVGKVKKVTCKDKRVFANF